MPDFARVTKPWRTGADGKERGRTDQWCPGAESNHRHRDFQSRALPTELPGRRARGREAAREAPGLIEAWSHTVQNGREARAEQSQNYGAACVVARAVTARTGTLKLGCDRSYGELFPFFSYPYLSRSSGAGCRISPSSSSTEGTA